MRQFLPLLAAAALGSAATIAVMNTRAEKKPAETAEIRPAPKAETRAAITRPGEPSEPAPTERNAGRFGGKNGGRMGGGMLADVEGVSPETMAKIRGAFAKAFQSENVRAARGRLMELGKQAEFASEQEKLDMRRDFEDAMEDMRKATREALLEADPTIAAADIEKVMDAVEERRRSMGAQGKKK